jgi:hypothetical protein
MLDREMGSRSEHARGGRTRLVLGAVACIGLACAVLFPLLGKPAPSSLEAGLQRSAALRERERANATLPAAPASAPDEERAAEQSPRPEHARRALAVPPLAELGAIASDGTLALDALRIRVTTKEGAPVRGVRVSLDFGAANASLPLVDSLAHAWTDADGYASIDLSADTPLPDTAHILVDALTSADLSTPIESRHLRGEVVAITVPPLGTLELRVLDVDGAALHDHGRVELSAAARSRGAARIAPLADGRAEFEFVELGSTVRGRVLRRGATSGVDFEGAGPTTRSQRALLHVRLGAANLTIVGALVGAFGGVAAEKEFTASLVDDGDARNVVELGTTWTGPDGRFRIVVDAPLRARGGLTLRLLSVAARDDVPYRARVALALPFDAGVRAVGKVELEPLRLLVNGRAFSSRGPVHSALYFEFFARAAEAAGSDAWEPVEFDHVASMRYGGEFSIYGACDFESFGLRVGTSGAESEIEEVERGSSGGSVWLAPRR